MYLSKSKYCLLRQCPKLLWLDTYHRELRSEDPSRDDRMATGSEVGDLAMGLFGDYTEVTVLKEDSRPDVSAMIEKTKECISAGVETICEAAFSYDGLYCAVDILRKQDGGYAIYEVKSSTKEASVPVVPLQPKNLKLSIIKSISSKSARKSCIQRVARLPTVTSCAG